MKSSKVRLSKILSHCGICSRREAEKYIKEGYLKVNGKIFTDYSIESKQIKKISIFDKVLNKKKTRIWIFNKPINYVSSNKEQGNQRSLFKLFPKNIPRLVSVGRLDIMSEGLMIFTNNPTLSNFLEKPKNKITRKYKVIVKGDLSGDLFVATKKNFEIAGQIYQKIKIQVISSREKIHTLKIELIEGKNREIRKIMKNYKLVVKKLKRVEYGPFKLGQLELGKIFEVNEQELNKIFKKIGYVDENNFW